jgi:uncharacterized RDD family membrane protein YckC
VTKNCSYCGSLNPEDAAFCSNCAFRFEEAAPTGEAQYPPPEQPQYPLPPGQSPYQQYPPPGYRYYHPGYPRYAGFWIRFAAYLIDGIVLWVARFPVVLVFFLLSDDFVWWGDWRGGDGGRGWWLYVLYNVVLLSLSLAYYIFMTGRFGATLGKMVFKMKVVGEDMRTVSYGTAALRETVGKFVSTVVCGLGYIWAGFDDRKQAWHDKIAHTFVIITGP